MKFEDKNMNTLMEMRNEDLSFLLEFWKENTGDLCMYCVHYQPCRGEACPEFKVLDSEERPLYLGDGDWTCMELDFAECPLLKDGPCWHCSNGVDNWEWNGKPLDS